MERLPVSRESRSSRQPYLRRAFDTFINLGYPIKKQQNAQIQKDFLDALACAVNPQARVIIVPDAGFQNAWFRHIKSLGWDFIGRIRGNTQMRLTSKGEYWFRRQELQASSKPGYLGHGTLARSEYAQCDGFFTFIKNHQKGEKTSANGVA